MASGKQAVIRLQVAPGLLLDADYFWPTNRGVGWLTGSRCGRVDVTTSTRPGSEHGHEAARSR